MPLHTPFQVESLAADGRGGWRPATVTCTFLDANHCPGAVMVSPLSPRSALLLWNLVLVHSDGNVLLSSRL